MQEIKLTWPMAHQIIRVHGFISVVILISLMLLGVALLALILYVQGEPVSLSALHAIIIKYRGFFAWMFITIYVFPVNMYAVTKALHCKYKKFRIVIYATSQTAPLVQMDNVSS